MKERKANIPAIIISVLAVVIIAGICVFGIIIINEKSDEISAGKREAEKLKNELMEAQKENEDLSDDLDKKKKELQAKEKELVTSNEEKEKISAERDRLVREDEERKRAEQDTTARDLAEQNSINSMLWILNDVEELVTEVVETNVDMDMGNPFIASYEKFKGYQAQFNALKDVPENFYAAGADYLNTSEAVIKEYLDSVNFVEDYDKIIPLLDNYAQVLQYTSSTKELSETSSVLIDNAIDEMNKARCPVSFEFLWERWKYAIRMVHSFTERYCDALEHNDILKQYSAGNLMSRTIKLIENLEGETRGIFEDLQKFTDGQVEDAKNLLQEISDAKELEYGQRSLYIFKSLNGDKTDINCKTVETIYPALYNTYDHLVFLEIGCVSGNKEVVIECEIPGLTQKFEQKYKLSAHMMPIYIKPAALSSPVKLDSAWDSSIKITIKEINGNLIDTITYPVHIKSINDFVWYDDEFGMSTYDNILCFLAPESEAVTEMKRKAIDILEEITSGKMNLFAGYQGPFYSYYADTFYYAASLMMAMSDMGVRYNNDMFSIDGAGQHILFPQQVLKNKSGLCVETALVIASALQSADMHTYLLILPTHVQVAVEVWDGKGEYFLIETTDIPCTWDKFSEYVENLKAGSYDNEKTESSILYLDNELWDWYINNNDVYLVDCKDGKLLGLTPFAY